MPYLTNAFSLNMLPELTCKVSFKEVQIQPQELEKYVSAIGHAETAAILGVKVNRVSVKMNYLEPLLVAQYVGPRLPEGATTLPEGATIKFIQVDLAR